MDYQLVLPFMRAVAAGACVVLALGIACIAVLIVVVLVLVLRTARDSKLGRFKFSFSASLLKGTFGIEVESQREPDKLPPGEAGPSPMAETYASNEDQPQ